jgi:adenylate cyclase
VVAGLFKRKGRFLKGLLIAAAIGVFFCVISLFNLFHGMQLQISDNLFKAANLSKSKGPAKDIVIVAIDDKSLEQLGYFSSWPRTYHAQVIDTLARAGARVIVFDMLFSEPAPDDEELAASMRNAGNIILPFVYTTMPYNSNAIGEIAAPGNTIKPLGVFERNAAAIGHAVMLPDEDGIIRRLPLFFKNNENYEPSMALATVSKYLRRPQIIESPAENNHLSFAGRSIPLEGSDCMLIKYTDDAAAPLNLKEISYVDVLKDTVSSGSFQDKIVVIGATATGIGDKFWTPMGRLMNGVELHAIAMQTLLGGKFLRSASPMVNILSILLLAILCGLAVLRLRVLWATLSAVFLCIIYFLLAFFLFDNGTILNMLQPPAAIAATFVGMNIYSVIYERSEKNEITKTFGRYISPPVVNKILTALKEDNLKLGGEAHEITVLFADARHFTSMAENIRAEAMFELLNSYMTIIVENILKYDGIVNNFGGDSIMAVWNAPLESEEHALLATRAAIDTQCAIKRLHDEKKSLLTAEFGIGINTGEAIVGNMGSKDRLEYSVIGDTVNVAARLASAAPGGRIWLGADTYLRVKDQVMAKRLDPISVKGRHEPVLTYEISDIQNCQIAKTGEQKNLLRRQV